MKKVLGSLFCALLLLPVLVALEVDRKEIEPGSAGNAIEFINYNGPYKVINSIQEINGIGKTLGTSILSTGSAGDRTKYFFIHAVDPQVKTGFDADILMLGEKAGVDHIDNLRRIIAAYLQQAYGYTEKDSSTLATFITVYNAVYRGKIEMFKSKYKPVVNNYLLPEKVGLSLRYNEWPGKTQIVIPLSDIRLSGTISSLDTTALTEKAVVDKLKEDKETATTTRKDMVDLKEKEAEDAQKRAEESQKSAAQARIEESQKKTELATAEKTAKDAQIVADQAKTPESQKIAEDKKAVLEQKQAEVAAVQKDLAEKETVAKEDQTLADTKQKETQAERKEIASDMQKEVNAKTDEQKAASEASLASAIPGFGLKVVDSGNLLSELVLINLNDGTIMKTSTLNTIRGRTLFDTGNSLMAIAGKQGGNSAIKLVLLDPKTLETIKQGSEPISETSVLVQNGNDFYAVIDNSSSYVVGRFDKNLDIKAKSAIQVQPYTPITVTAKGILVQDTSGKMKLLRTADLTE